MYVNTARLKGKLVERGLNQEKISKAIGMDRSTFSRKMRRGGMCFTISEMYKIVSELHITNEEACEIFLADDSRKCEKERMIL